MIAGLPLVFLLLAQQLCPVTDPRLRFLEAACSLLVPIQRVSSFWNGVRKELYFESDFVCANSSGMTSRDDFAP